jgi:hypothetical protein
MDVPLITFVIEAVTLRSSWIPAATSRGHGSITANTAINGRRV